MIKIVVTENLHPDGIALLESRPDLTVQNLDGNTSNLIEALHDADGILVRTMSLTKQLLGQANRLQLVSRHGVGCDNIDLQYLTSRQIPVAIAVDSNTTSVIEHVLMMMLVLSKRAIDYNHLTLNGEFTKKGVYPTSELAGKHVLIVGFGRIGKRVAGLCKAFDMRVSVADINLDYEHARILGVETAVDFHSVLETADYLTLHVPLDNSTRNLINAPEIAKLPRHSIVINCARGGIVNEEAIAMAMNDGAIAGFGSDVFETEPPGQGSPLMGLPNTILTPHNAAGTAEGLRRMAVDSAQNILDHFDGKLHHERIINFDAIN